MSKKERNSGIELLRIVAACFVVILHYCNPQIGGAMAVAGEVNYIFLDVLRSLGCCAVDVFIVISGYFLINTDKRVLGKPLYLYFQLVSIHLIVFLPKLFLGKEDVGIFSWLQQFLSTNYFVTLYIILYFLSPIINMIFQKIDKDSYLRLLTFLFLVFSIYPTVMDVLREISGNELYGTSPIGRWGSQHGYTIVNFIVLYIIGAYVGRFGFPMFVRNHALITTALCVTAILIWGELPSYLPEGASSARSYHNPVVITLAVSLFSLFSKLRLHSRIINELAGAAFSCFLIHLLVIGKIHVREYASGSFAAMCAHLLISIIAIYIFSYLFYKVYDFAVSPIIKRLNKISLSLQR